MSAVGPFRFSRGQWAWCGAVALGALVLAFAAREFIQKRADAPDPARVAYEAGDWSDAAGLARARLDAAPTDLGAARTLARASARLGRDETALRLYQEKIGVDKMAAEDHYLLGLLIEREGNTELALGVWTKALRTSPDDAELLEGVARLASKRQRPDLAAGAAERLAGLPGRGAVGLLWLGAARSSMDDPAGAADAIGRALKIDPNATIGSYTKVRLANLYARNLLRLGEADEARATLAPLFGDGSADPESAWLADRADLQQQTAPVENPARDRLIETFRSEQPLAVEPAPFVGSARCQSCHREIANSYAATRHARTFHQGDALRDLPYPDGPVADPDRPDEVSHVFERGGPGEPPRVLTRAGETVSRLVIDYAFGTPERALTMVGRDEAGAYRGARLSYYHGEGGAPACWDRTSGDAGQPDPAADVRGQVVDARDGVVRCLACHVTNPRDFLPAGLARKTDRPSAASADRAIGCERCHGPGAHHLAAVEIGRDDPAIFNAGGASAVSVNAQCRECHVVGDPAEISAAPDDPRWVRSPGLTFTFSRCATAGGGPLSCLTCHDPHRDSPTSATFYESKCLECHGGGAGASARSVCKVNPKADCLGCHMPKVPVPTLHDSLTDHYIRVRPGEDRVNP